MKNDERTKARGTAARALREAGVKPSSYLTDVLAGRIEVDGDEVRGREGKTIAEHLAELREDRFLSAAFEEEGSVNLEGKSWGEMTPDEKVQYTEQKYGS